MDQLAVRLLENSGHKVEIADNGQIAVNLFKGRHQEGRSYDIILMDVSVSAYERELPSNRILIHL